jgi:anti-anti-sigma regulatory factor
MENAAQLVGGEATKASKPCVELRGTFDGQAARQVLETIQWYVGGGTVLLDFREVSALHDCALAFLAAGLSQLPGVRIETRGLLGHSTRLLQYLRIDPCTLGPVLEGGPLLPPP